MLHKLLKKNSYYSYFYLLKFWSFFYSEAYVNQKMSKNLAWQPLKNRAPYMLGKQSRKAMINWQAFLGKVNDVPRAWTNCARGNGERETQDSVGVARKSDTQRARAREIIALCLWRAGRLPTKTHHVPRRRRPVVIDAPAVVVMATGERGTVAHHWSRVRRRRSLRAAAMLDPQPVGGAAERLSDEAAECVCHAGAGRVRCAPPPGHWPLIVYLSDERPRESARASGVTFDLDLRQPALLRDSQSGSSSIVLPLACVRAGDVNIFVRAQIEKWKMLMREWDFIMGVYWLARSVGRRLLLYLHMTLADLLRRVPWLLYLNP